MNLKDFVAGTLVAIGEAMAESAEALDRAGVDIARTAGDEESGGPSPTQMVRFDLAVEAVEAVAGTGPVIEVVAGDEGNGDGASAARIRFSVPLSLRPKGAAAPPREPPTDLDWE